MNRLLFFGLLTVLATAPATAQNLLLNPGFDTDLSDWASGSQGVSSWDPADASDSDQSGSARLETSAEPGVTVMDIHQCVNVGFDDDFVFGAQIFKPLDEAVTVFGSASWYASADCIDFLSSETALSLFASTPGDGKWQGELETVSRPEGAMSVLFRMTSRKETDTPVVAFFDDLVFMPGVADASCIKNANTLCLNEGRFEVTVDWRSAGDQGIGTAIELTEDTGYFWFFNSANVELVVKVLDACETGFNAFWVFAAGLTDVEVDLVVRDTEEDVTKVYLNDQGNPFEPVQDTAAFKTCS